MQVPCINNATSVLASCDRVWLYSELAAVSRWEAASPAGLRALKCTNAGRSGPTCFPSSLSVRATLLHACLTYVPADFYPNTKVERGRCRCRSC